MCGARLSKAWQKSCSEADSAVAMEIVPLGDSALIVRVDDSIGAVLATLRKLEAANISPAFASVALFLESPESLEAANEAIGVALRKRRHLPRAAAKPRLVEVPVCYDVEFALDLEFVAQHCGLSPNDVVARHAAARYDVRCVGFTPGFPFLGGLPAKLATPRRKSPRPAVPAGSVGIGGPQTGIYPLRSPGGWNIIGRTPLRLFDVTREPAVLFRAGDRVHFFQIRRDEFERWEK